MTVHCEIINRLDSTDLHKRAAQHRSRGDDEWNNTPHSTHLHEIPGVNIRNYTLECVPLVCLRLMDTGHMYIGTSIKNIFNESTGKQVIKTKNIKVG